VVEAAAVWAPVEAAAAPVTVVEAELSNDAHRHSAQEAHSPRATPGQEPEKSTIVEAPDGVGTPTLTRCSVQVVVGPRVARQEAPRRWWAQQKAPEPRVAR
jgi:hypothetical protein